MKNLKNNQLYNEIDLTNIPNHIAIIMDGNGRWAKERGKIRSFGHYHGVNRVVDTVRDASNLGINVLTLYAFSTENWKRPSKEIEVIMSLVIKFIDKYIDELARENVILKILGDASQLPVNTQLKIDEAITKTKNNDGMILNICLNYGGRQEILRAAKLLAKDYKEERLEPLEDITLEDFERYLYTNDHSNVDLMIRPSGELRVSNFLLYQLAYSEFYFSDVLWPDFDTTEFLKAIISYQNRNRRFGGLNE